VTYSGQPFASPGEALAHYGVKGMKWGVRKDDNRSTESRSERKASKKALTNAVYDRVKNDPIWHTMTKAEYNALSSKGEEFAVGTTFKRITDNPSTTVKGATYVSHLKEDSEFYRAAMPALGPTAKNPAGFGGRKSYKKDFYEIDMKAVQKLSSPSEKERVDAYISLLETPSVKLAGKNAPITGRQYLEQNGYKPFFRKYDTQELAFRSWHDFTVSTGDQKNPLAQAYFQTLKDRGYNAIPDDNDGRSLTKKPMILLDPESTVGVSKVHRLTTDEINKAQRSLARKSSVSHRDRRGALYKSIGTRGKEVTHGCSWQIEARVERVS
jgi:hypothetical protein